MDAQKSFDANPRFLVTTPEAQNTTPSGACDCGEVKLSEHEKLLQEWQNRLGLQDWRIKLADNCVPDEMTLPDVAGDFICTESNKTARIEMLDPMFYGERIVPFDWEKTLVHELLHLKLCLVSENVDDLQARYMHQIIDDLARAFVDAKRVKNLEETE